jgi:NitT/TauT family transport system substrate-binding protein
MTNEQSPSGLGKIISLVAVVALIGLGLYVVLRNGDDEAAPAVPEAGTAATAPAPAPAPGEAPADLELAESKFEVPRLSAPAAYEPKDPKVIDVEISEYAGYSGLIVANGGLAPSDDSYIFKKHGYKLNITISEDENWGPMASGEIGASVTTVDVVAVYGRQLNSVVPVQIGFSRGADGIVVASDIRRINQLKGRILITAQFTEAEFFVRFLAQEAGIGVNVLADAKSKPDPDKVNLVFMDDAEAACAAFGDQLEAGGTWLAGCIAWAPFTNQIVEKSGGKAHVLVTNRNLLIVADVLLVNKGLAEKHPKAVAAMVDAVLEGNRLVRADPRPHLDVIGKTFKWERSEVEEELKKVHLSNLPENLAFFSGAIDAAGSFGGIYQAALLAYGSDLVKNPIGEDKLHDGSHLAALDKAGAYKSETIQIAPIKSTERSALEADPLLSKDIRFFFEPNSSKLDLTGSGKADNEANLVAIKKLLQISPGSSVLLRGHVDDARVAEFRKLGGEAMVNKRALEAAQLSKDRAEEVRRHLLEKHKIEDKRVDIFGAGWNEPVSKDNPDQNRRVEVHWFTLE